MENFYQCFAETARRYGTAVAVEVQRRDALETFTYSQLLEMAEAAAARLAAQGVSPGDRCVLLADNDAQWCAAYLGIFRLGAIGVPMDTNYSPKQIAALLRDCGSKVVVTTARFRPGVCEALAQSGVACKVAMLDEVAATAAGDPRASESTSPARREDVALILYTSGTTSDPKGVVLTHGNLLAERESILASLEVGERDTILGVLPLFHALPQLANLLLPFTVGARVVFLETVNTTELLRALEERGITIFCCVPQFFYLIHARLLQQLAAAGRAQRAAFRTLLGFNGWLRERLRVNAGGVFFRRVHRVLGSRMRLLVTGGSRFDPAIGRDLFRMGFDILQAYGLTECTAAATLLRLGDPRVDTVGQPMPGIEVRIAAPEASASGEGGDGEVLIRGANVMQGYYNRPAVNAETLRDGWLYSGDLGRFEASGHLRITGRKKDVIILSSGKNIYPEEIEAHYLQSPYIKELCVMGLQRPGEPAAERLHAVVTPDFEVMRERKVLNTREILRYEIDNLGIKLPSHKRILSYEIWTDALPRTTTRKLKRFEIARHRAEMAQSAQTTAAPQRPALDPADAAWAAQPEVARALEAVREAGRKKIAGDIHPDANIELELGLDSMERVELLTHLEQMFGTTVTEEVMQKIYTVRELVAAVIPAGGATASGAVVGGGDSWARLLGGGPGGVPEDDAQLCGLLEPKLVPIGIMYIATHAAALVARLLLGCRATGTERLPDEGACLVCPNHESFLDPFLLVGTLPWKTFRRLFFVGASEYFATPLSAWLARKVNIVPVDPDTNLVGAMQAGAFGLRHGKVLVLFPEGERTVDGEVKNFKKGAAILSLHTRARIVPVALRGFFEVWPRGRSFAWKKFLPGSGARIRVRFGAPLALGPALPEGCTLREAEARYATATTELRDAVVAMWKESGRKEDARMKPGATVGIEGRDV
jgi:long-chain acyl-CoA synthetase